ncbi:hypothetical protein LTR16_010704, partial [Cryomyces antarcticus]
RPRSTSRLHRAACRSGSRSMIRLRGRGLRPSGQSSARAGAWERSLCVSGPSSTTRTSSTTSRHSPSTPRVRSRARPSSGFGATGARSTRVSIGSDCMEKTKGP